MRKSIHIICEGLEEYKYLKCLKSLDIFSSKYDITLDNAKGSGSVFILFHDAYMSDSYDLVLICIDTDRKRKEYNIIKGKMQKLFENEDAYNLIIFSSPCIMQIIILHFELIFFSSQAKKDASFYLKKYIEFDGIYDAHEDQLDAIMKAISKDNYKVMKNNLLLLPEDDTKTPSSNFMLFLNRLESDDVEWILEINDKLL